MQKRSYPCVLIVALGFSMLGATAASGESAGPAANKPSAGFDWTHEAFNRAFAASGRRGKLSRDQFEKVQSRKKNALAGIEQYLTKRFGKADVAVMRAFQAVPREYFQYQYANNSPFMEMAYEQKAKSWAIGYGSALSDYIGQAYMTQLARPTANDVVLEIGTGSGFQVSVLSRIVKKAYSVEIVEPLGKNVSRLFEPLGYKNIETRVGDGYFGWPEAAGGFDVIMVTCAAQFVPPTLFEQLKPGGRLIIPIGQPFKKGQILYVYTKDAAGKIHSRKDVGVYFIPMTGAMMKKAQG